MVGKEEDTSSSMSTRGRASRRRERKAHIVECQVFRVFSTFTRSFWDTDVPIMVVLIPTFGKLLCSTLILPSRGR